MIICEPMKAGRLKSLQDAKFPCLVQPKYDGIRCVKVGGQIFSRSFKPIRNRHVVACMQQLPDGVDGELIAGPYNDTQSAIMSYEGAPDFTFVAFDLCSELPYTQRLAALSPWYPWMQVSPTIEAATVSDLERYEEQCLDADYEGICIRDPKGPYKFGRSTVREGYLLKYKRIHTSEARILGFEEQQENTNPLQYNAFGRAKRPGGYNDGYGRAPKDTMGNMLCVDIHTNINISLGSGFDNALRQRIWDDQEAYLGKVVEYAFQSFGAKNKPRFPRFLRFRDV